MTHQNLRYLLTVLLSAGPLGVSAVLTPPAMASMPKPPAHETADVAVRLAKIQTAVAEAMVDPAATEQADPNIQKVWWGNHGWGRRWGWGNGGWGWHNGGWHNGGWGNGGWRNGGWGNWHPWANGWGNG